MTTLAELRQASLQEQKKHLMEAEAPAARDSSADEVVIVAPSQLPIALADNTPAVIPTVNGVGTANGQSSHAPRKSAEPAGQAESGADPQEATKAVQFMKQVHRSLSHKTMHDNGTRVTVDMPVSLFHRAKRYCVEHGNVTLRQVLLDLLRAYLDEEGY